MAERFGAQLNGAVDRIVEPERDPLDLGISARRQAVRQKLRGRQDIAQVVTDLAHGETERGEPVLAHVVDEDEHAWPAVVDDRGGGKLRRDQLTPLGAAGELVRLPLAMTGDLAGELQGSAALRRGAGR